MNKLSLKVAFIHTSTMLNLRGSENYIIRTSQLLKKKGIKVSIVNFDYDRRYSSKLEDLLKRKEYLAAELKGIDFKHLHGLRLRLPTSMVNAKNRFVSFVVNHTRFVPLSHHLFRIIRKSDVVYFIQVQSNPAYLLSFLIIALLSGKKNVIAGLHVSPKPTQFQSHFLKTFSRVGSLRFSRTFVREHISYVKSRYGCDCVYVPSYVDTNYYNAEQKQASDSFNILYVGALTFKKGADTIPRICGALETMHIQYKFYICSPGGPLADKILQLSLTNKNVIYYGFVRKEQLRELYHKANVVIVPSRQDQFPVVPLEAQACGTPVIVSDVVGLRECVPPELAYLRAKAADYSDFSNKIRIIFEFIKNSPENYNMICTQSRKFIEDRFTEERVFHETLKLFLKVAGKNDSKY